MHILDREQVQAKLNDPEVAVVEVLPREAYELYHLPRAINVPFDQNFDHTIQSTIADRSKEVIVYCKDTECSASPKAAQRMEALGYSNVFDYDAGKEDWRQAGLTVET